MGKYRARTQEYDVWFKIITRCYDVNVQLKCPTYADCSVHENWHNFQNFADWYTQQKGYGSLGWEVDKDILFKGNKQYGPDTCCLAPKEINLLQLYGKSSNGLPTGVSWHKQHHKYYACCGFRGKQVFLGLFDCPKDAHYSYKCYKEKVVKFIADYWKDKIDTRLYNALMEYKVSE